MLPVNSESQFFGLLFCLFMASQFNETISMDLKSYNNVYFLVLVDLATRYCAAIVIGFLERDSIFGTPKKILSDNGVEFSTVK